MPAQQKAFLTQLMMQVTISLYSQIDDVTQGPKRPKFFYRLIHAVLQQKFRDVSVDTGGCKSGRGQQ